MKLSTFISRLQVILNDFGDEEMILEIETKDFRRAISELSSLYRVRECNDPSLHVVVKGREHV